MADTNFNPLTNPIDFILLAGRPSPGIAEVVGAGNPRKWDEQSGPYLSGAFLVGGGNRLSHFTVKIRLYTNQDWVDWHDWRPLVERTPYGQRPRALDIWHPWLVMLKIKSVVVEDVGQPEPDETGGFVIPIKFVEFRRPKLTLLKPTASEQKKSTDPADRTIENLTQILKNGGEGDVSKALAPLAENLSR
jgi:hypothetical protein